MKLKNKFIQILYEIVIYVFPFILILLILVSFQLWKLENTKEKLIYQLTTSSEKIVAAQAELNSIRHGLISASDSFDYYTAIADFSVLQPMPENPPTPPGDIYKRNLIELGTNVLKRVSELKKDSAYYIQKDWVITESTGRYYAIVISYSEFEYAIIQREYLRSLGFNNVKVLVMNNLYALSIDDAADKSDEHLKSILYKWDLIFITESDGFIKKF